MSTHIFRTIRNSVKHWYIPLIVGVILIGLGIYTFVAPEASYLALALLFSLSFLLSGIFEILFSIANKDVLDNWGWTLGFGVLTLAVGILLFINPAISMITLAFYVGFLILFRSISAIGYAVDFKRYGISDWGVLMLIGVLGLIFAFLLIWNPILSGMTVLIWTGLALITSGVFSVYFSFKLKKLNDLPNKISDRLRNQIELVQQEVNEELRR
ncbi:DUF308 domain-containing protein [Psychrobacter sp. F1192]|uniref:DUF308 domain-containing protein n=1 Tax=Psychrobacter coccoides TaxID=2818440 RepID=A0ABS3NRU6_9GAMM|nr:DUF308 domain-containing protein [Psychrobacter coccoides]MBO1531750.1 DUF308 domain-containing protein [Psychrobacter coccoides]